MNVRDIDFSEDFLVYASPAGIVEYDFQNNNYKTISFDDGISFGKIKKIHIDSTGNYWITSSNKIQIWSTESSSLIQEFDLDIQDITDILNVNNALLTFKMSCLLYTSPSPRDVEESRMPSSA